MNELSLMKILLITTTVSEESDVSLTSWASSVTLNEHAPCKRKSFRGKAGLKNMLVCCHPTGSTRKVRVKKNFFCTFLKKDFFGHKYIRKEWKDIPNILSPLHIDEVPTKREFVTMFLGVYLDKNISYSILIL